MDRVWSLGWYVRKEDIHVDPYYSTRFIEHDNDDECHASLHAIIDRLREIGTDIAPLETEFEFAERYEAQLGSDTVLLGNHNSILLVGCVQSFLQEYVHAISVEYGFMYYEMSHGKKSFRIKDVAGEGSVYTGHKAEDDLFPCKYFELKKGRLLIAKAYVPYYNGAMDELGPTIELLEVRRDMQGKGVGRKLVRFIEKEAREEGFDVIYVTDANKGYSFFKKMGYTLDDGLNEEGWRYLSR